MIHSASLPLHVPRHCPLRPFIEKRTQQKLKGEDTRSSLLSTSERMSNNGTDKQTDGKTNGNSHELLSNAEPLTVGLVDAVGIGPSGKANVSNVLSKAQYLYSLENTTVR